MSNKQIFLLPRALSSARRRFYHTSQFLRSKSNSTPVEENHTDGGGPKIVKEKTKQPRPEDARLREETITGKTLKKALSSKQVNKVSEEKTSERGRLTHKTALRRRRKVEVKPRNRTKTSKPSGQTAIPTSIIPQIIELLRAGQQPDWFEKWSLQSPVTLEDSGDLVRVLKDLERSISLSRSNDSIAPTGQDTDNAVGSQLDSQSSKSAKDVASETELNRIQSIALSLVLRELTRLKEAETRTISSTERKPNVEETDTHADSSPDATPSLAFKGIIKGYKKDAPETDIRAITARDLEFKALNITKPPIPRLAHGLDRVLFNPGVYYLRDPRSKVYNFDPYLEKLMPVSEFDFSALRAYIQSSSDTHLIDIAKENGKKYVGSTSSMTSVLSHFHFLLSQWRPIDTRVISKRFAEAKDTSTFSQFTKAPTSIFLRWRDGSYAIDYDNELSEANVLMKLGHTLEKMLTSNTEDFERYRLTNQEQVPEERKNGKEAYHYSTQGDMIMRSQLDAHDPRLPGSGVFDLKTRAVVSIRFNPDNIDNYVGYQLRYSQGEWESFEREQYDMMRSTLLKYSLQVRMGRMNGIFVAYHNVERMFGFQYFDILDIDQALHGQETRLVGDQEFKLSLDLFNRILDQATQKFPEQSIRLHFETRPAKTPFMYIFAQPVTEDEIEDIQRVSKEKEVDFERRLLGLSPIHPEAAIDRDEDGEWTRMNDNVDEGIQRDTMNFENRVPDPHPANDASETRTESPINTVNPVALATQLREAQDDREETSDELLDEGDLEEASDETSAREDFANTLADAKPLLGMVLAIRNKVDDEYVLRPNNIEPHDTWTIEYALKEIDDEKARKSYKALRRRKYNASVLSRTDSGIRRFREVLASYSSVGRKVQDEQDEVDDKVGRIVYSDLSQPKKPGFDATSAI